MKKVVFIMCAMFMCTIMQAQVKILFTCSHIEDKPIGVQIPKIPMRPPVVYIEDYTLSFVTDHPEYILNIKDEDGEVVYSTTVFSAMTQVTLPSTLSGDYEIELLLDNWKFTGWINM